MIRSEGGKLVSFVRHPYDRYVVELYLYECKLRGGEPRAANVHAFRWVTPGGPSNPNARLL